SGGMVNLNHRIPRKSGWVLWAAHGINDAGQIVGVGYHGGRQRAFLLTPDLKTSPRDRSPRPPSVRIPHTDRVAALPSHSRPSEIPMPACGCEIHARGVSRS